jgi:hypothetical protein
VFVSVKGSPYARFQRALARGKLDQIRDAAAELPQVELVDALQICLIMSARDDERFDRAAARWLARFTLERPGVGLEDLRRGLSALRALPHDPSAARRALGGLCAEHGLVRAQRLLADGGRD